MMNFDFPKDSFFRVAVLFFILLTPVISFVVSCDDNEQNTITRILIGPEGGTAASSDGRLMLDIPPGALEEETEITVERIENNNETGTVLAFDLQPEGLNFLLPVGITALIDIDNPTENEFNFPLITTIQLLSEGILEIIEIDEQNTNFDTKIVTVTAEIEHFSNLFIGHLLPDPMNDLSDIYRVFGLFEWQCEIDVDSEGLFKSSILIDPLSVDESSLQNDISMLENLMVEVVPVVVDAPIQLGAGPFEEEEERVNLFNFETEFVCLVPGSGTVIIQTNISYTLNGIEHSINREVEKEIQCTEDESPGEFPPDVEIFSGGDFNFTHVCNVTPCPQLLGNIDITNNSNINTAKVSVSSTNQSTIGFIDAPVPANVNDNTLLTPIAFELEPGETITIVAYYRCDREESFTESILIDGVVIDGDGQDIPETEFNEEIMVNATVTKPGAQFPLEEGPYNGSGNCQFGSTDLTIDGDNKVLDPLGANSNVLFNATQFDPDGNPISWQSASSNLTVLGAQGHECTSTVNGTDSFLVNCTNSFGGSCNNQFTW